MIINGKRVKKVFTLKKPTPQEYSEIKKNKNIEKCLKIAKATKNPALRELMLRRVEKLKDKYKKQKSWTSKLLKKI